MNTLAHGFTLDALRVEPMAGLVFGPGGRERLDPKVMDVLLLMAERAGQVVLREELLARLWPNAVVTDDALTRCFYELRRCLVHAGGDERFRSLVETVPKRGYRLVGTVGSLGPADAAAVPADSRTEAATRRKVLRAAGAGLLVLAALAASVLLWRAAVQDPPTSRAARPLSIAVLPFLDMSAEQDQQFLSDGVSEEVLNHLSRSDGLRVIARTSSFALRDQKLDVPQIAERLGVDYVLEGSVRKSGDRIRVTAQLIDAGTNAHVWSRTFEGEVGGIFAIQDEVAGSVATALEVALGGDGTGARRTPRVEAYEDYLKGKHLFHRRSPGDVERSVTYFEKAVAADPDYATAWAILAGAYALMAADAGSAAPGWRAKQGEAARRAVELEPGLAAAHARLGQFYFQTGDRERGEAHFQRATTLDPDDLLVLGFSSTRAVFRGEIDESVEIWRRIVARDPLSPMNRHNYAHHLMRAGRIDEAIVEFENALELNPGPWPDMKARLAAALAIRERYPEAKAVLASLPAGKYRDYAIAMLHRSPGDRAEADAALQRLSEATEDVVGVIYLAEVLAARGRHEEAFAALRAQRAELDRNFGERPRRLWEFRENLLLSYLLVPLHADPRWQALVEQSS